MRSFLFVHLTGLGIPIKPIVTKLTVIKISDCTFINHPHPKNPLSSQTFIVQKKKKHKIETTDIVRRVFYIVYHGKVNKAVTILTCIREVPCSYLSRGSDCHDWALGGFPRFIQVNYRIMPQIRSWRLRSTSIQIPYSFLILPINTKNLQSNILQHADPLLDSDSERIIYTAAVAK
jgi:hypothetical protein